MVLSGITLAEYHVLMTIFLAVPCIFHSYSSVLLASDAFNLLIYAEGAVIVQVDIQTGSRISV